MKETSGSARELSIISTNYNCAHALGSHLESIYTLFDEEDFEYVLVDNYSEDQSIEILHRWAQAHRNFRFLQKRCTMGMGREVAARNSSGSKLLVLDTDTVYFPVLRPFVDRATREWPNHAVQAIYAGVFPRALWDLVGGRRNFNSGEDLDMWMRLWTLGHMKWYPTRMGENLKEPWARDTYDHLSSRYTKLTRIGRLVRREFDLLRLAGYEKLDLADIWKRDSIDLGLGPLETVWFGERRRDRKSVV